MIQIYYHTTDGIHIAKTITQNLIFQELIKKHLAEFQQKSIIADFHGIAKTVILLSQKLNLMSEYEDEQGIGSLNRDFYGPPQNVGLYTEI